MSAYRYPVAPFGNAPDTPPMVEDGAETLYQTLIDRPAVNAGVSVIMETPGARVDPFYLGARDENTVQGFAGTPVNVNALTSGYLLPVGAAGAAFPRQQRFFVAVDSGRDPLHRTQSGGPLRAALLGQRRVAAVDPAADDVGRGGPPDVRASRTRLAVRRRSVVLDDRLPGRPRRRVVVRPGHRRRRLLRCPPLHRR